MNQHKKDEAADYERLKEAYLRYEKDRSSEAEAHLIEVSATVTQRHGKVKYRHWYDRIRSILYTI